MVVVDGCGSVVVVAAAQSSSPEKYKPVHTVIHKKKKKSYLSLHIKCSSTKQSEKKIQGRQHAQKKKKKMTAWQRMEEIKQKKPWASPPPPSTTCCWKKKSPNILATQISSSNGNTAAKWLVVPSTTVQSHKYTLPQLTMDAMMETYRRKGLLRQALRAASCSSFPLLTIPPPWPLMLIGQTNTKCVRPYDSAV
ncbi:hypothetical protein [Propioniciclava flava]